MVLKSPHAAAGTVALYSTTIAPVVSCNLIGYVNPGAAAAEEEGGEAGGPLQAVFAPVSGKAEAAALLSVGLQSSSSGELCRVANVLIFC